MRVGAIGSALMERLTSADLLPWLVAGLAVVVLVLAAWLVRSARAGARLRAVDLAAEQAENLRLQERLADLERRVADREAASAAPSPAEADFLITDLGAAPDEPLPAARIEGRLFADLVLRETVVKAASLAHGVRRALAPEQRLRMRAEFKREVRRSRKQRRAEIKEARRHLAQVARQRAAAQDAAQDSGEDAA